MGLKCRLFGHTYGTPEVERSREEAGDEVVVTIRNIKRCERCGDEQMVNQTKEVTSVRTPEDVGLDAAGSETTDDPAGPDAANSGAPQADSPVTPVGSEPSAGSTAAAAGDSPGATPGDDPAGAGADDGTVAAHGGDGSDALDSGPDEGRDEDAVVEEPDTPTAGDAGEAPEPAADDGWETGSDDWDDVDPDPDIDDAVILDAEATARDEVQWPEESDADPQADADTAAPAAAEDTAEDPADAEIIDGGDADPDAARESADGPDHEDAGTAGGWPDHDGTDEGYSATPNGEVDAEFDGNGLTPEVNGGAPDDPDAVDGITVGGADGPAAEYVSADADTTDGGDAGADQGFVRAGESTTESDVPADSVEFYCPNCGYAQTAGRSSMRAGDICPDCKQGYIAERQR